MKICLEITFKSKLDKYIERLSYGEKLTKQELREAEELAKKEIYEK